MDNAALLPTTDFLLLQLKLKGIWQQRGLGQHFLHDAAVLERIAAAAGADAGTLAVEIGPGPGTLTALLARQAGGVMAVEYDERLRLLHEESFGRAPQVAFRYGDALKIDLQGEARQAAEARGLKRLILTGNLPFQITSPLLFAQCGPAAPWDGMTVMIQKEVADRIVSPPGRKDYGILSVKLAYWWRARERFDVDAGRFFPRPKVDASVIVFEPVPGVERPNAAEWPGLSEFVDAAFAQRRKMLVNSLAARWRRWPGKEAALAALTAAGHRLDARAEMLSPSELAALYRSLAPASAA